MSAAQEIAEYERHVNEALRSMAKRHHYEAVDGDTPLSALMQAEGGDSLEEWGIRNEAIRTFLGYLCADGPHPAAILRRLYAVGSHMAVEPFCLLTLREKGLMLGDSHGAQHWRMQRLCNDPLARKGAHSVRAPGQKGKRASASAAAAQAGNSNRKKKSRPRKKNGHSHVAAIGNGKHYEIQSKKRH